MKHLQSYILGIAALISLSSCEKNDEPAPDPKPEKYTRTILAYAIASNNLSGYITKNREQMLAALQNIDLDEYNFMIYEVYEKDKTASLKQAQSVDGVVEFVTVKQYNRDTFSTDPARVSEVITDVTTTYPSEDYDMFFLSHGSGWEYDSTKHPVRRSLGYDLYDKEYDYLNIDELASAIPDSTIDMIWFDNCYMGNVETVYQLKDKCEYIVACPTEIWSSGTPYDRVVPQLLTRQHDITGAAKQLADYYSELQYAYTVSVMDMSKFDNVASSSRKIYTLSENPSEYSLLCYTRRGVDEPLYDFGQFMKEKATMNGHPELAQEFGDALNNLIIYTSCSERDFNNRVIDMGKYHGISVHYFTGDSQQDSYYRTLNWYRDVIE